ncbi:MAG: DEAD/DEAH box helicase [Chitinophagaceae bacterium]|nr:MAG: DEAD/DEAH box helicase [Chitinophagaceae bacterium]
MRALVSIFAALLILISLYQLSFTWFVNKHESSMKERAMQQTKRVYPTAKFTVEKDVKLDPLQDSAHRYYQERLARLLDSTKDESITWWGQSYQKAKESELLLGLDLQGGINVTLDVALDGLIRGLANNAKDPALIKALEEHVLDGLMKLRQICNSPLLMKNAPAFHGTSCKITELMSHITEKTIGHKLLVFSQFTSMLGLVRTELENQSISYAYLDGKTTPANRKNAVENFQNEESIRVFLISLKAGGVGLNLTAADYVYLLDPWWNPAKEAQAIDRCYRIGQDKHVMAYKVICKDTLEERILDMQQRKKRLADELIPTDEGVLKTMDKDEILGLLD